MQTICLYWLPALGYMVAIYHYSTLAPAQIPNYVPHCDKLLHFAGYVLLVWLWMRVWYRHLKPHMWVTSLLSMTIVFVFGLYIEFAQIHYGRCFEIGDIIANAVGGISGALVFVLCKKLNFGAGNRLLKS
jgi:VanZ family protein